MSREEFVEELKQFMKSWRIGLLRHEAPGRICKKIDRSEKKLEDRSRELRLQHPLRQRRRERSDAVDGALARGGARAGELVEERREAVARLGLGEGGCEAAEEVVEHLEALELHRRRGWRRVA